ncbi:class I SAM-dependent methyltransferase [Actinophytocola gossypii]|uniref:Methyltransferase domain-containing protein n=1 Tax=Actinophytocola gossypii TaxID=2812003 RepID=A0ABT2JIL9_9PSEU|nr:class I SAM-dependent methyltransferase [Actinophytocola gossypii]MCT2587732.1 methyltransferase domain-containing protein [Actinophytocola gossypii]
MTYLLPRTSTEYRRLRTQARIWEPATTRLLDQVGVAPGARCLDVGCGPGEVMRLLAQRVGPSGSVTGVDLDGRIGAEAVAVLRSEVDAEVSFVEGDVHALDLGRFDVVYVRLVLMHLPDPVALLRRLWELVAPGGVLVAQDYDTAGMASMPRLPCWDEFERVMDGVYERTGGDPRCGLRLPAHFVAAGVGAPDGTDVSGVLLPLADTEEFLQRSYASTLPAAIRLGITTEEAGERCLAGFAEAAGSRANYVRLPTLVGVYRRRSVAA